MRVRDIGESVGNLFLKQVGRASARVQQSRSLEADVLENDEEYLVVFDAPGATASDVQVRYDNQYVRVRIDRFRDFFEGFEMRVPGRGMALDGDVRLPDEADVDYDDAEATLTRNGTLEVHLPKRRPIAVTEEEPETEGATEISTDEEE